jgi:hypothetical protein
MLRSLRLARRSAVKARTQAANQRNALLVTAPDGLGARLRGLPLAELVTTAARLRPDQVPATTTGAAKFALGSAAGRWLRRTEEITELDVQLERLVAKQRQHWSRSRGSAPRRWLRCWSRPETTLSGCAASPGFSWCSERPWQ